MRIAITSGKGGVGKTFVATCLADVIAEQQPVSFIDCDVEAPNAHLFLKPDSVRSWEQMLKCVTGMDAERCIRCGLCARVCYFNALAVGRKSATAFPELCRGCGACRLVCPRDALIMSDRSIGTLYAGDAGKTDLRWASLATGAGGMTVRLIEQLLEADDRNATAILDSPPGTSCAVVHTVRAADVVVLVADPTPFGRHDLRLSVHMCRELGIRPYVVINRTGIGDAEALRQWCRDSGIDILLEVPDSRRIAELCSQGLVPVREMPELKSRFMELAETLLRVGGPEKMAELTCPAAEERLFDFDTAPRPEGMPKDNVPAKGKMEIAVLSGKGGTGKTSLAACLCRLSEATAADCDVDAADLHMLLRPAVFESRDFSGGRIMFIDHEQCIACGKCIEVCTWDAISMTSGESGRQTARIHSDDCEGCGACLLVCPADAVYTEPTHDGMSFLSVTREGNMSHAVLEPGKENSGKLVTLVRRNALGLAGARGAGPYVILDGSPGTGCPVIASLTGARAAVIVTEPTPAAMHDLARILDLAAHFRIPAGTVINKSDLNSGVSEAIREMCRERAVPVLGELPYDSDFIHAQEQGQSILEYRPEGPTAQAIHSIWTHIQNLIQHTGTKHDPHTAKR